MRVYAVCLSFAFACHSSSPSAPLDGSVDGATSSDAPAALSPVTFTYTPDWMGVQSIDVIGGFGQGSADWTTPFVSLTEGSDGTWSGTGMVAPGTYPYLFDVVGDNAAGPGTSGSAFSRYSVDGTVSEFEPCPAGPTVADNPNNPCSLVSVPQGAAETLYDIRGSVVIGGSAADRYLVMLERDEGSASHHYFVNRRATGSAGDYTFDVAAGSYRVQVLHASYFAQKDSQIDPETAATVRRDISTPFAVGSGSDVVVSTADVTPPDYTTFEPRGSATLPTTFTFPAVAATKLDVYGSGNEIGDPWFTSAATGSGSASFDGTFNTMQATQTTVSPADTYRWGIEYPGGGGLAVGSGGGETVKWTAQSLTYSIAWPN
ncbi:MAG TPA: hypothetical protein VGG74_35945 [Kofleriaceae bacterium]